MEGAERQYGRSRVIHCWGRKYYKSIFQERSLICGLVPIRRDKQTLTLPCIAAGRGDAMPGTNLVLFDSDPGAARTDRNNVSAAAQSHPL